MANQSHFARSGIAASDRVPWCAGSIFGPVENRLARRLLGILWRMVGEAKIVEVSFFGGKILVTFDDGMMTLLEPGQVRQLAIESNALSPVPTDDIPS